MSTAQTLTLHRALKNCGGPEGLAKALKVPVESLRRWISGHESPSAEVYIATLKLVTPARPKFR
jgi:hypothetical protein